MLELIVTGVGLGMAVAAPVGPMSLICVRRTLDQGAAAGLLAGLGIALADGLYGLIAAGGFASLSGLLVSLTAPLQLAGGLFMLWLGRGMLKRPPPLDATRAVTASPLGGVAVTFGLTLANPATIMSFIGMFASLGVAGDQAGSLVVAGAVFLGSALWWTLLISLISLIGKLSGGRAITRAAPWIGRASALAIAAYGGVAVWRGLVGLVGS